jgi:hypothetical protein
MANTKTDFNLPHPKLAFASLQHARKNVMTNEVTFSSDTANLERYEELGIVERRATMRGGRGGWRTFWTLTDEGKELVAKAARAQRDVLNGWY